MKYNPVIMVLIISVLVAAIIAIVVVSLKNKEGFGQDYNKFCDRYSSKIECKEGMEKLGCGSNRPTNFKGPNMINSCGDARQGYISFQKVLSKVISNSSDLDVDQQSATVI
jgi:hypothetical protein